MPKKLTRSGSEKKSAFIDTLKDLQPEGVNLSKCESCDVCTLGCPATGLEGMDPKKFISMAAQGLDDEIISSPWIWMCTLCQRCSYLCPMKLDIPKLVYFARGQRPREERPQGILNSCDMALRNDSCSAMGATSEDFGYLIEDLLEEYRESQPEFSDMNAPIDKKGAHFFVNQNSREPVIEPDEMFPLWKIFHLVGADWTYGSKGWAAENYCMFLSDDDAWEHITRTSAQQAGELGCKVFLNTE